MKNTITIPPSDEGGNAYCDNFDSMPPRGVVLCSSDDPEVIRREVMLDDSYDRNRHSFVFLMSDGIFGYYQLREKDLPSGIRSAVGMHHAILEFSEYSEASILSMSPWFVIYLN